MTTPDLRSALERIAAKVTEVIEDAESQHPGGWGPDVTTVAVLREARDDLLNHRAALAQPEPLSKRSVFWDETAHIVKGGALASQPEPLDVERLARAIAVVWSVGHPDLRSGLTEGGVELAAAIAAEYAEPDQYDE